jgi:secretion/DNA translocation related TadE-like protein
VLAIGLVILTVALGGAAVGAARVARHQARAAADLGALAGAGRTLADPGAVCPVAEGIVRANGGALVACEVDGLDVRVTVRVRVVPLPGVKRAAHASARAGPLRG